MCAGMHVYRNLYVCASTSAFVCLHRCMFLNVTRVISHRDPKLRHGDPKMQPSKINAKRRNSCQRLAVSTTARLSETVQLSNERYCVLTSARELFALESVRLLREKILRAAACSRTARSGAWSAFARDASRAVVCSRAARSGVCSAYLRDTLRAEQRILTAMPALMTTTAIVRGRR